MVVAFFFFFKQKTAYEMRISDWSSDVCSSDLKTHQGLRRCVKAFRERLDKVTVLKLWQLCLLRRIIRDVWRERALSKRSWNADAANGWSGRLLLQDLPRRLDRKSTRLNSSH